MTRLRIVWLRGRAGWLPTSAPVGLMDALAELEPDDAGADPLADVVRRAVAESLCFRLRTALVGLLFSTGIPLYIGMGLSFLAICGDITSR